MKSAISSLWIDGEPVELASGSELTDNLRELNVHSLKPLNYTQDNAYSMKVTLSNGVTYEGRAFAGIETMVVRNEARGTLYTREFTSRTELTRTH